MTETKVFRIWIKSTPEKIWQAITDPEWNAKYGYAAPQYFELKKGGKYHSTATQGMKDYASANGFELPDPILDGEVLEAEAPRRLVQSWRMLMDPNTAAEGFTTLTYEIEDSAPGVCRVTITHDVTNAPAVATMVSGTTDASAEGGGGWAWVLSDLKSLLETGKILADA
ncbi:SRPBCC domain-containing protein [Actinoplanes regularis]|uniref:SRPBCC domain-containing protein n=1 Tax=Actinoplanes regularis TaxID=52697 RepID=UPI0024A3072A|nr:SRPBCC domain-containing protein [Actinoplanes regularis]GLW30914.1 transcriptional regulator [Actinoplanes regularis]